MGLVRQARDGDHDLGAQLFPVLALLRAGRDVPPDIQSLARVLLQVLAGETSPDLTGLPPELAEAVRRAFDLPEPQERGRRAGLARLWRKAGRR